MTLIPNTYKGLVSAVKALAEDDSLEFESYIDTAIFNAHERLNGEIDLKGLENIVSVTASAGNLRINKPSDYLVGFNLTYNTSTGRKSVFRRTESYLRDYWPVETSVGQPKYYSDENLTQFKVVPTPVSAYTFEVQYLQKVPTLTSTTTSNTFTNVAPDALFYGTMSNMAEFMKDYEVQAVWEGKYAASRDRVNNRGRRERRDDGQDPMNIETNKNTLKGDN